MADELWGVRHVIRTMKKPTARCLGGKKLGLWRGQSGRQSSASGHETVLLIHRTLFLLRAFLSYRLSSQTVVL